MTPNKLKTNQQRTVFTSLLVIFILGLSLSVFNIIKWQSDNKKTSKQLDKIYDKAKISNIKDNPNTVIIEPVTEITKSNPYWDYIKINLIDVDFRELKTINPSIVGWLTVKGTNINYPFVQGNDNKFYLTHSFDKSFNKAGWVFLDYRNHIKYLDKNNIIYGHGRLDKTMFGTLKNIIKNNWYQNEKNHILKISTDYQNTLWQIFSLYTIDTTSDYLKISFTSNSEFLRFNQMLIDRSIYNFKTKIEENDKIITLSTCYNKKRKVVMHAKLIKIQQKTIS